MLFYYAGQLFQKENGKKTHRQKSGECAISRSFCYINLDVIHPIFLLDILISICYNIHIGEGITPQTRKETKMSEYCIVLDTETTSTNKPFCYDIGYVIVNTETFEITESRHFIIEQIWHNIPLFSSAYYAEKRPLYVKLMRSRKAELVKFGYAMRTLYYDIKRFNVKAVYAYNCNFDDKVIQYNCDYFKCINPIETIPIFDVWGYASQFITCKNEYKIFCEKYQRFTESGNYSGNAETVYQFITETSDFVESHMGLHDAIIETKILQFCIESGAFLETEYKVNQILPRIIEKPFTIKVDGRILYKGDYISKSVRKDVFSFKTKQGD